MNPTQHIMSLLPSDIIALICVKLRPAEVLAMKQLSTRMCTRMDHLLGITDPRSTRLVSDSNSAVNIYETTYEWPKLHYVYHAGITKVLKGGKNVLMRSHLQHYMILCLSAAPYTVYIYILRESPGTWCLTEDHQCRGIVTCGHSTDSNIYKLIDSYYDTPSYYAQMVFDTELCTTMECMVQPLSRDAAHDLLMSAEVADIMFAARERFIAMST